MELNNIKYSRISDSLYIKGRIGWKGLKKEEYLENGNYQIINGKAVKDGIVDWSLVEFITKERYYESPEIMLKKNDIVITKDGTIGKIALIDDLKLPTTVASGLFVLRNINPEKWNTRFLYYYLISPFFNQFVNTRIEGSVIPHLYQRDFEQLELPELSIKEQNKIVTILSIIDEKIENNYKINHHLVA
ncbi:MAG: restriction endonuclease subunit S [Lachnospiraceae bacterium]|nr:restriction endonuclease subunit S [Lachnospiraceae bacterium]